MIVCDVLNQMELMDKKLNLPQCVVAEAAKPEKFCSCMHRRNELYFKTKEKKEHLIPFDDAAMDALGVDKKVRGFCHRGRFDTLYLKHSSYIIDTFFDAYLLRGIVSKAVL